MTATKKRRNNQHKYASFATLCEGVAAELYSQAEWDKVNGNEAYISSAYHEMLSEVYDLAFERKPEAFEGIQWINSDDGIPAWVRPGVEWSAEYA